MSLSITAVSFGSLQKERNPAMLHQTYLSQALNDFFSPPTSAFSIPSASPCVTSEELSSRILLGVGWLAQPLRPSGSIWEQSECLPSLQRTKTFDLFPLRNKKDHRVNLAKQTGGEFHTPGRSGVAYLHLCWSVSFHGLLVSPVQPLERQHMLRLIYCLTAPLHILISSFYCWINRDLPETKHKDKEEAQSQSQSSSWCVQ